MSDHPPFRAAIIGTGGIAHAHAEALPDGSAETAAGLARAVGALLTGPAVVDGQVIG